MAERSDTEQLLADIERRIGMAELEKNEALDQLFARKNDPVVYRLFASRIEAECTLRTFDMRMQAHSIRRALDKVRQATPPRFIDRGF